MVDAHVWTRWIEDSDENVVDVRATGMALAVSARAAEETAAVTSETTVEALTLRRGPSACGHAVDLAYLARRRGAARTQPNTLGTLQNRWQVEVGDAIVSSAVVDAEQVIFGLEVGKVHALSRADGKTRWVVETWARSRRPGRGVGGHRLRDGKLRALRADSGAEVWVHDAKAEITGAATFVPPMNGKSQGWSMAPTTARCTWSTSRPARHDGLTGRGPTSTALRHPGQQGRDRRM